MNSNKMKAIVCLEYGGPEVLELREIAKPSPKANEVLVKIFATPVTAADGMMREGTPRYGRLFLGLRRPNRMITGTGFAGEIESVGKEVKNFQVGDRVFGEVTFDTGSNAEYVCLPEDGILLPLPENMSFEEAAPLCDGALTSINFLRNLANIQAGQSVLIIGASGSLGTAAVQLARFYGAKVTGVCSGANAELVRSLGADEVIDYTTTDFTKNGQQYDIIYDTVGKSSFSVCKASLSEQGQYLSPVLSMPLLFKVLWTSWFGRKKAKFAATGFSAPPQLVALLKQLKVMIEAGHFQSVIDRRYPLEETVAAHRYVDTGHKRGNVVLSL